MKDREVTRCWKVDYLLTKRMPLWKMNSMDAENRWAISSNWVFRMAGFSHNNYYTQLEFSFEQKRINKPRAWNTLICPVLLPWRFLLQTHQIFFKCFRVFSMINFNACFFHCWCYYYSDLSTHIKQKQTQAHIAYILMYNVRVICFASEINFNTNTNTNTNKNETKQ